MARVRGLPADPERTADLLPGRPVSSGEGHELALEAIERRP
jgi:hypothetical protein